jgi:putative radical SAM enzyme (TIGR03279 family)
MIRIAHVVPGTIAAELGLPIGLALLSINGHPLRDGLDLLYYQADEALLIDTETADGEPLLLDIEKEPDEPLGIVPEPDKVRRCTNACPFCFVKGNPKVEKLRAGLYVKDDDYRLSFLHGHYITLTNLRPDDWDRIFDQRLSPLYVSVHATDPEARLAMLKNPRSAAISEDLDRLGEGGIAVHAQVVLCPEINDGPVLERTMSDLYGRGDSIRSLSIVPVGLTSFNSGRGVHALTADDCRRALASIDRVRAQSLEERGLGWCYAADELFLQAGLEPPGPEYFDQQDLESNGVGAISLLTHQVRSGLGGLPTLTGVRVVAVTGASMGPTLARLTGEIVASSGVTLATTVASNTLYGDMVTTAGLLSGDDHARALVPFADFDVALLSAQALNDRDTFLDDMSLSDLRTRYPGLRIEPSRDLVDVLGTLSA